MRRDDVLQAVVELGEADTVTDIAKHMSTIDFHSIAHHLFHLRRDGLVTFDERRYRGDRIGARSIGSGVNGGRVAVNIRPVLHAVTTYLVQKG